KAMGEHEALTHASQLLAVSDLHRGDLESALRNLAWAAEAWPEAPYTRPSLLTAEYLGDLHLERGDTEAALRQFDEVWPKAIAVVPKGDVVAELRRRRAECYLLLGRAAEAHDEAKTGLEHCRAL